jgi:DNA-binding XRE family transcriptional regulator
MICLEKLFVHCSAMKSVKYLLPEELAALAKKCRAADGKTQAEAARDMGVKRPSVHHAEESPHLPYTKLRRRMIEKYSNMKVTGPLFRIESSD